MSEDASFWGGCRPSNSSLHTCLPCICIIPFSTCWYCLLPWHPRETNFASWLLLSVLYQPPANFTECLLYFCSHSPIHLSFISLEVPATVPSIFSSSRHSAHLHSNCPMLLRILADFLPPYSLPPQSETLPSGLHTVLQCHNDPCCLVLSAHLPATQMHTKSSSADNHPWVVVFPQIGPSSALRLD